MLKAHKLILILNAAALLICILWGYWLFTEARQLVGNNVVYITGEPGRRGYEISLDNIRDTLRDFADYNIAFEYRRGAVIENGIRNIDVNLAFTNSTYFLINNYFFLYGGGWPYGFDEHNIIVLSENAAWELFGNTNVVGMHVELEGQFFEIGGVIKQEDLENPGFAWITYNHRGSGISNVGGIYIQGRDYNNLELIVLAHRFAYAAELNLNNLRFVDLDQYTYNILTKFNLFVLVIAAFGAVFSSVGLFNILEAKGNRQKIMLYSSLTAVTIFLCIYLWQNISIYLPPPTEAFRVRSLIDNLNNLGTFEGIGIASLNISGLYEHNRLSVYPLVLGTFAFVNIAGVFFADAFIKYRKYSANKGTSTPITIPEYLMKRILQIIPTFMIMTAAIFFAALLMPTLGIPYFPRDAHIMYFQYIFGVLQGDFGSSWTSLGQGRPVSSFLVNSIPYTAILVFGATLVSSIIGVTLGVIAALKQNRIVDNIITVTSLFASSIPVFFLAIILMLIFSLQLGLLPSRGLAGWQGMILPIATLSIPSAGFIARTTRTAMLEALTMDCIKAARARGLPERVIIGSHALKNIRIPIITITALRLVELFMGTLLVETAFSIPGLGRLLVEAIEARDLNVMMGCIIFLSLTFMVINLAVDLLYVIVDPRTRKSLK
ncbi:MAG: ABC transporter permease subunit [Defluviitaleaceae bacterium]|nr:ABC transporter permease subunit [Defluviitaleaceae bacterium]